MKTSFKTLFLTMFIGISSVASQPLLAFTGHWNYSWGDIKTSSVDIGTSINRTCFLSGIGGNFYPGTPSYNNFINDGVGAGVRKKSNGNYELYVEPHPNTHLIAYARCVNTSSGRVEVSLTKSPLLFTSSSTKLIVPATARNQCFLQGLRNKSVTISSVGNGSPIAWDWGFKASTQDSVLLQKYTTKLNTFPYTTSTKWGISIVARPRTDITATAVCFNANQRLGDWVYGVGESGYYRVGLINESDVTCGLTGIKGQFNAALGDWKDAAYLSQEPVADYPGLFFFLNIANGKAAWVSCIK